MGLDDFNAARDDSDIVPNVDVDPEDDDEASDAWFEMTVSLVKNDSFRVVGCDTE